MSFTRQPRRRTMHRGTRLFLRTPRRRRDAGLTPDGWGRGGPLFGVEPPRSSHVHRRRLAWHRGPSRPHATTRGSKMEPGADSTPHRRLAWQHGPGGGGFDRTLCREPHRLCGAGRPASVFPFSGGAWRRRPVFRPRAGSGRSPGMTPPSASGRRGRAPGASAPPLPPSRTARPAPWRAGGPQRKVCHVQPGNADRLCPR